MRAHLVAAVFTGEKTATSSLHQSYLEEDEPLPEPGLYRLVDATDETAGVVEVTDVEVRRVADVDDEIAQAEGEGFASADAWRRGHQAYWGATGEAPDGLHDDLLVVVERFHLRPDLSTPPA